MTTKPRFRDEYNAGEVGKTAIDVARWVKAPGARFARQARVRESSANFLYVHRGPSECTSRSARASIVVERGRCASDPVTPVQDIVMPVCLRPENGQ
jgi:hypothetical protein